MAVTIPTVFVVAATSPMGGALSRQLRDLGWTIRAMARDADKPAARSIKAIGVNLVQGDWSDYEHLRQQLRGVDLLFLPLPDDIRPDEFLDGQVEQARNILRIARDEGVRQIVYVSGMGCNDLDNWGVRWDAAPPTTKSIESKHAIESLVRASNCPLGYTILRPGFFMANFVGAKGAGYTASVGWKTALRPETGLPLVDHEDIARFAIAAFRDPEKFRGAEIALFSELTELRTLSGFVSGATGKRLKVSFVREQDGEEGVASPFVSAQVAMQNISRFAGEGSPGKKWGVDMTTLEDFLRREGEASGEAHAELGG
ncbi:hypothetical protein VPNG_08432 [Cytospora leucostoma]|uniref:NmrA-like domain-containing protein n=1 Tax=Cytospora leucostoma TaxID=1230097 RepID=A0A423W637_9PEZI|nr:hypothetical protein VPNG_08432 [Cytospora leucostoma]